MVIEGREEIGFCGEEEVVSVVWRSCFRRRCGLWVLCNFLGLGVWEGG